MEMEQYSEALQWLYNAMHTSADKKYYKNYGALYSNIAAAHNALGNTDSARYYIDIAIKDARENENLLFLATALSMQARIFVDNKQQALAEAPLHEVLEKKTE
jgi:tetratricopeptide (TPR) repeat protein